MQQLDQATRCVSNVHRQGPKENIFLLSTPRSGSTWLMEIIASEPHLKPCNEPFDLRMPAVRARLGIADWQELASPASLPRLARYLEGFVAGRFAHGFKNLKPWQVNHDFRSSRIVFKVLFAFEDQIAWLKEHFSAQVVCLLRHPIPVSLSREELPRLSALLASESCADLSDDQRRLAETIVTSGSWLEQAQLDWCLQNRPLLKSATTADLLITYEQLVMETDLVVRKLGRTLGLARDDLMQESARRLSGSVTKSTDASRALLEQRNENRQALLSKWRQRLSRDEEDALMAIVDAFDIDIYRAGEIMPGSAYLLT